MTQAATAATAHAHPLDPLTTADIARATELARSNGGLPVSARFVAASTAEPVRGSGIPLCRAAEVIAYDATSATTYEYTVDLAAGSIVSRAERVGVQPPMCLEEIEELENAVRRHPAFQEALRRRGIDDADSVIIDPAPAGAYGTPEEAAGGRLARVLVFARPSPGGNPYSRPLDGIDALVDLGSGEVKHFADRGVVPFPRDDGEYRGELVQLRPEVRPIHISQPEGPSFKIDGHLVSWQKWRLRVGFNSREGLVLHQICYDDDGRLRPILNRASIAEMVVPYADPDRFYQTPFDIGEFNLGTLTNSLTLGCDCLGVIHYFDAAWCSGEGRAIKVPNAICLHEEDDGIIWKHTDFRTGHVEVRRGRRLVISTIVTAGNYEYGFYWYFRQDGSIEFEVKATGIVLTQALAGEHGTPYGKLVAPHLNAYHHQHIFCARLDFALDGGGNSVTEMQTESAPPSPANPYGNAWTTSSRVLRRESDARRDQELASARSWIVINPNELNGVGQPVGYRLVPGENAKPFSLPGSSARRRAGFMDHHLWVTPYRADERYPAGDYPYQHPGGDGLPRWVQANRSIEDTDIVVWYTMNHHHVPRPEDWPVMPVARLGFELKPWGFFDRNPALDVPPTAVGEGSCHAGG